MTIISKKWNALTSILSNLNNFPSLEVVDRVSETQLQVGGNSNWIIWRLKGWYPQTQRYIDPILKQCWAVVVDGGPKLDQHCVDVSGRRVESGGSKIRIIITYHCVGASGHDGVLWRQFGDVVVIAEWILSFWHHPSCSSDSDKIHRHSQ